MEIDRSIDKSQVRKISSDLDVPLTELLLEKISDVSSRDGVNRTLLAVCPNSLNVMKAALRSAKRANAPIKFAATLNQVDIDGGYTRWTQNDLVRKIKEESCRIGYGGPIIVAVDHGGPWVKDLQTIEKWDLTRAMDWIKKSFEAAVFAGYDLIHVDATVDIHQENMRIETVVERTIELILHTEKFRKGKRLRPISYEVGTEEVHGGLADIDTFRKFLDMLKDGLAGTGLEYVWPVFIVAKVGTDLHTTTFDKDVAKETVDIARSYGSYIKGHYTDFVSNPEDYPESGMGAANVGPEFTMLEYDALSELCSLEERLYKKDRIACRSNFMEVLKKEILNSNRWQKWLLPGESDFESLSTERKEWILKTSSRYIRAHPNVRSAQFELYRNLELNGIDAESWVLMNIEKNMDKYFRAFNLIDLNAKIKILL